MILMTGKKEDLIEHYYTMIKLLESDVNSIKFTFKAINFDFLNVDIVDESIKTVIEGAKITLDILQIILENINKIEK